MRLIAPVATITFVILLATSRPSFADIACYLNGLHFSSGAYTCECPTLTRDTNGPKITSRRLACTTDGKWKEEGTCVDANFSEIDPGREYYLRLASTFCGRNGN